MKLPFSPEIEQHNLEHNPVLEKRQLTVDFGLEYIERAHRLSFGKPETSPPPEVLDVSTLEMPPEIESDHEFTDEDVRNLSAWTQKLAQNQFSAGEVNNRLIGGN